jgi:hypothetical protein
LTTGTFRSVDFKNGRVILLDQARLPREEEGKAR